MGFYREQVLPRIVDKFCGIAEYRPLRERVTEGLEGDVLEIGFGSGLNLPYLPPKVNKVLAVDPSEVGRRLATKRIAEAPVTVEPVGLDGEDLPLESESVDAALSTLTLCTIPDVDRALREVHRVLRLGGELHFLEHGLSPDPKVATWQHRLTPLQRRVAGGCHFDRPIERLVTDNGFVITELENLYLRGPKTPGYMYLGIARKAG